MLLLSRLLVLLLPTLPSTSSFVVLVGVRRPLTLSAHPPYYSLRLARPSHSPSVAPSAAATLTTRGQTAFSGVGVTLALSSSEPIETTPGKASSSSRMDLLDSRLQNLGSSGYYFVKLDDNDEEKKDTSVDEPVHVKTLIWEAVLVVRCSSGSGRIIEEIVDHHFVTALRVADRVDLQRLYDLVKEHTLESLSTSDDNVNDEERRLLLRLAGRDVAEELVGYQSGTMPPIAHSTSMPLYIDDTVASMSSSSLVSVGAGDLRYDLYMPTEEMIRVANISSLAVHVAPLSLQKAKSKEPNCCKETSSSSKLGQKTLAKSHVHQTAVVSPDEASSEIEEQMAKARGKLERANILRKAAKKKGNAEVLCRMLDAIGDEFPELMECEEYGFGGIDKNALHTAAWKGDLETITLLIERGNAFGLDLVNTVSVGSGNYGKTPIFYALTQCREDVVLLLIANGADLLVVNNKGQSPCSIAVSHLKPEVCQIMYDVEASQLQNGGSFKNYRKTNSVDGGTEILTLDLRSMTTI